MTQDTTAEQSVNKGQITGLGVYYEIATRRLDDQTLQRRAVDAKTATVFTLASSILPIFVGLLAVGQLPANQLAHGAVLVLVVLSALSYAGLTWFLFRSYQIGDWDFRPTLPELQAYCATYPENTMRKWVANACVASLLANEPRMTQKVRRLQWAMRLLPVEVILLVAAACVTLVWR